jgi:UDP-N-acetylglucosamine--N-acetylmuramyl-(pentapeptide) pyrophosphoryl-undecaprenol N-acetylglucosamine transferase
MNILIIAGGTGGHVYPALSIAKEFQDDGNTIFWIGKKDSLEENIAFREDFSFFKINARGFLGKNFFAKINSMFLGP